MRHIAIGLTALSLFTACSREGEPESSRAPAPTGERLTVQIKQISQIKPLAGEITTRKQADALARIPGILLDLKVREGDQVTRGELIGRIVESRLEYEANASAAQIAAAQAQATNARAALARVKYLYDRGFYAKARLDEAEAAASAADAEVRAARAQHSASASLAGEGAVIAPATGRVLHADVPPGSPVTAGMPLATITAGPPLVRLDVPQSLANQVLVGTRVTLMDGAELNGRQGKVVQVYPAMTGGRVRADVEVPGVAADFVGRRVSANVPVGSRVGITLPRRFVSTRFGVDYVSLLDKSGSAVWVPVQTAPAADPNMLEILSGVSAGDVVIATSPAQ